MTFRCCSAPVSRNHRSFHHRLSRHSLRWNFMDLQVWLVIIESAMTFNNAFLAVT